jgi:hypothetical protein
MSEKPLGADAAAVETAEPVASDQLPHDEREEMHETIRRCHADICELIAQRDALIAPWRAIASLQTWNEGCNAVPQARPTKADLSNQLDAAIEMARVVLAKAGGLASPHEAELLEAAKHLRQEQIAYMNIRDQRGGPMCIASLADERARMAKASVRKADNPHAEMGAVVVAVRQASGLNLDEFALAIKKDPRQVKRWEEATDRPQIEAIYAVDAFKALVVEAMARPIGQRVAVKTVITIEKTA